MKIIKRDDYTLEIIEKLYSDEDISTAELVEVLKLAGFNAVMIDYIAAVHTRDIEGKNCHSVMAKRLEHKLDAFVAVSNEFAKDDKPILIGTAIGRAAKTTGVPRTSLRRYLEQSIRKK